MGYLAGNKKGPLAEAFQCAQEGNRALTLTISKGFKLPCQHE